MNVNGIPFNDKEIAEFIFGDLFILPTRINEADTKLVNLRNSLRLAQNALEQAELDAVVNAVVDGKNAELRKLQQQQAVANDPATKTATAKVIELQNEIAANEVDSKTLARRFQAALALAELQAARLNLLAKYNSRKEIHHE